MRVEGYRNVAELPDCCQCGMCESLCPNVTLRPTHRADNQDFWPSIQHEHACDQCTHQICLGCCPVIGPEAELAQWLYTKTPAEIDFGPVQRLFVGYARDRSITGRAASGGVVTGILKFLLERNEFAGAIVVVPAPETPLGGKFIIVEQSADLAQSCSSIYAPVTLGRVMRQVLKSKREDRFVFVGRPCQIRALNKAMALKPALKKKIGLKVAVFCAWLISIKGVEFLSNLSGVGSQEEITSINYRSGRWPGSLVFTTQAGAKPFPLSAKAHTYGTYYYPLVTPFVPEMCRMCFDVLGNEADIAVGDAWNLGLQPQHGHGYSLAIIRTEAGRQVIEDEYFKNEYVNLCYEINLAQLDQSQGQTIRLKQAGVLTNKFEGNELPKPFKRYHQFHKAFSLLLTWISPKVIPQFCYNWGLKLTWTMIKKRLDPAKYIQN